MRTTVSGKTKLNNISSFAKSAMSLANACAKQQNTRADWLVAKPNVPDVETSYISQREGA